MKFKAAKGFNEKDLKMPERKTEKAAGYDFYAQATVSIPPNSVAVVPTGVQTDGMPEDQFLQISLRSGTSIQRPLLMANGVGIIDADYEDTGEDIGIILFNRSMSVPVTIEAGERIAQGVFLNYNTVEDEKKPTEKRTSGKGSTGSK
jgi:dUTP pyrophosphatase